MIPSGWFFFYSMIGNVSKPLPDDFKTYLKATGGAIDNVTGLILLTADQYKNLKPLTFKIGPNKVDFDLNPNALLFPRKLNTALGGKADGYYLIVADIGRLGGSGKCCIVVCNSILSSWLGLDFILGYTFL